MTLPPTDPVALTAELVRCCSVTPQADETLRILAGRLKEAGFDCKRVDRSGVPNLFARWGEKDAGRTFGFNGHTDVVPPGDEDSWTYPAFGAEIHDGRIFGRGSVDMKSGVAAFAAAAMDFVRQTPPRDGALILTVTGDEEGPALHGTRALLEWMQSQGERMDVCLVGEPTCPDVMGEAMKIGRRGSMTIHFEVTGVQGHAAYPHRAVNPLPAIGRLADRLASHDLDHGTEHFDPSTIAVVTIDTGNPATNVIPASARMSANIRFNDRHTGRSVAEEIGRLAEEVAEAFDVDISMEVSISGEAFLTPPGPLSDLVADAIRAETGVTPVLSTSGGTSDARFIKDHCPVVEFGLVGHGMHAVDESVDIGQIGVLKSVYGRVLRSYFGD